MNSGNGLTAVLLEKLGGLCGPRPKTLTLFLTKIGDIPYPIYDDQKFEILVMTWSTNKTVLQTSVIISSLSSDQC